MNLYEKIKTLYPSLKDKDFDPDTGTVVLRNDSREVGDYIKAWTNKDYTRPTEKQLNAITGDYAQETSRFSSLDYLAKFTDEEYAAARSGPMAIQRGLDSLISAQFVDVTDPRVDKYLSGLVAAKIIGKTRKAELLAPAHLMGLSQTKGK